MLTDWIIKWAQIMHRFLSISFVQVFMFNCIFLLSLFGLHSIVRNSWLFLAASLPLVIYAFVITSKLSNQKSSGW